MRFAMHTWLQFCACIFAMSDRPNKLQRLNQLRRSVPYVSQSALSAILADVKEKGVPDLHQRKAMQEATTSELSKLDAYGPLIQTEHGVLKTGGNVPVLLVNTLSYIQGAVYQGGSQPPASWLATEQRAERCRHYRACVPILSRLHAWDLLQWYPHCGNICSLYLLVSSRPEGAEPCG